METAPQCAAAGIPTVLLGRPYSFWLMRRLKDMLTHFGVDKFSNARKMDLMQGCNVVIGFFDITEEDEIPTLMIADQILPAPRRPRLDVSLRQLLGGRFPSEDLSRGIQPDVHRSADRVQETLRIREELQARQEREAQQAHREREARRARREREAQQEYEARQEREARRARQEREALLQRRASPVLQVEQAQPSASRAAQLHRSVPSQQVPPAIGLPPRREQSLSPQGLGHLSPPEAEASPEPVTCLACLDELSAADLRLGRVTAECDHGVQFCQSCLALSIESDYRTQMWNEIDCPSCKARLLPEDVQKFATKEIWEAYDRRLLTQYLSTDNSFQYCRHGACGNGQEVDRDRMDFMTCDKCWGRTCVSCDTIWHPNLTCEQSASYREEDEAAAAAHRAEERASAEYVAQHTKACPKCRCSSMLAEGCHHITCPRCKYEYCFLCLADYGRIKREGAASHADSCGYFPNNLPGAPGHQAFLQARMGADGVVNPPWLHWGQMGMERLHYGEQYGRNRRFGLFE